MSYRECSVVGCLCEARYKHPNHPSSMYCFAHIAKVREDKRGHRADKR